MFVSFPMQSSAEPIVTEHACRTHCMNETELCSAIVFVSKKQQCFYFTESSTGDYQLYTVDNGTQVAYMRVCSPGDTRRRIQRGSGIHSYPTLTQTFIFIGCFGKIWDTRFTLNVHIPFSLHFTSLQQVHFAIYERV